MRRQSSPADLRHSKLNRNTDLRDLTRSRRRASSVPPDLRKLREALISGLRNSMTQKEERVEEESDTSSSSSSDSNEEGEVEPSEDELTNVRYSESDTPIRTPNPEPSEEEQGGEPKPGPSGTNKYGPPAKSKAKEPKKYISPIKFPEKTPVKRKEEVPLYKMKPRVIKPPAIQDLRDKLAAETASSKPKIDSGRGPISTRVNCDFPPRLSNESPSVPAFLPWMQGRTPKNNPWLPATSSHMKWGTAHSSRSFIVGKTTSRNDSTMTGQEDEAPGIEGEEEEEEDGFNEPRREDE